MSDYTKVNLLALDDSAPGFGVEGMQARFGRDALGARQIGLAHHRMEPNRRVPFGHRHTEDEEIYVVLAGSGRLAVGEQVLDVAAHDAIHVEPAALRAWEAGPDGLELVAFGSHHENDGAMEMGWWPE